MVDININLKVSGHEKLRDYLASGIGATAGPLLATWRASRESKAKIITAKADAEARLTQAAADIKIQNMKQSATENSTLQLIEKAQAEAREYMVPDKLDSDESIRISLDDVRRAGDFQEKKRLMNVGTIAAGHSAKELRGTEVPDHDPDPDWTARFFDAAQDVSSEEMQEIWGKILAGEVKSPGQTSLRTLSILRDMTQKDARDFFNLMRFRIASFVFEKGALIVLGDRLGSLVANFRQIGLFCGTEICQKLILKENGKWIAECCGHALIIEGPPGRQIIMQMGQNAYVITSAGLELAKLCQHELDLENLSHFATFLTKQDCKLKIAKIIKYNANNFEICESDIHIVRPFVEPEERNQEEPRNAE